MVQASDCLHQMFPDMKECTVNFIPHGKVTQVPEGTLLTEAARLAGVEINQPCGGQGRCGRCAVQVTAGNIRRRSTLRLSTEDILQGYALACQSVVTGDVSLCVPEQDKVERRLTTDRVAAEISPPPGYDSQLMQPVRRVSLALNPPSMEDQTDDWGRLHTGLRREAGLNELRISLALLQRLSQVLRAGDWQVTVTYILEDWDCPDCPARIVDVQPGLVTGDTPLWGIAVDIGTTTVTLWLVDLISGRVVDQAAEYNGQIVRGEDVISRIIYAGKNAGGSELQKLVLDTIHTLIERACKRSKVESTTIVKAVIAGNSTMLHLLLGIPAETIRQAPFITTVNHVPVMLARDIGLRIHPEAAVDCLPGVASYVGADISAGVLSSGLDDTERLTLFLDVGTNGETVLGSRDWLVTCACSAGPAFEGAGMQFGMRATQGAIEEVWINAETREPNFRVIGNTRPRGVCGSGLIALIAEMFMTGLLDKAGHLNQAFPSPRIREGEHGPEYVIAWGSESEHGQDIVITNVDVDNLLRAKAAIYAGFSVLAESVGVSLEDVEQVLIGGSFGKYINIEKAIQIGLLPDMPWERFQFLGNTSVRGAYYALLDRQARQRLRDIASKMTYIELSADNSFYEAFMSALFLPHTELDNFPTVAQALLESETQTNSD